MALVPEGVRAQDRGLGRLTWRNWLPLAGVFGGIAAVTGLWGWTLEHFMAVFFLVFAAFKLSDLRGFAMGYADYDLAAMRWRAWGYIYPFVELGFGAAMAAGAVSDGLLRAEVAVMAFSGLGVLRKLARHEPVRCVCLGTRLKIPLTFVTLIEDFGMAAGALYLLST
jgi:hypothetical protein